MRNTEVRGPTLARWRLGREMQRLRETAGYTPTEAGSMIGVVRQTISRMERGTVGVGIDRIEALCKRYGAPAEVTSVMTAMAVRGNERGWWERHKRGVHKAFRMYAEAEPEADTLDTHEPEFLPGLVQTPEYIRHLYVDPTDDVNQIISARIDRQMRVFRPDGPRMRILVGIGAMHLLAGLPNDVRGEQITRLREISMYPRVKIGVGTCLAAALGAPFALVGFDDEHAFVYMDALDGCRYENDHDILSSYQAAFSRAWDSATPVERYIDDHQGWLA